MRTLWCYVSFDARGGRSEGLHQLTEANAAEASVLVRIIIELEGTPAPGRERPQLLSLCKAPRVRLAALWILFICSGLQLQKKENTTRAACVPGANQRHLDHGHLLPGHLAVMAICGVGLNNNKGACVRVHVRVCVCARGVHSRLHH